MRAPLWGLDNGARVLASLDNHITLLSIEVSEVMESYYIPLMLPSGEDKLGLDWWENL